MNLGGKLSIALFTIILIIFQGALEEKLKLAGFIDELILIVFLLISIIKIITKSVEIKMFKIEKYIFILVIIFFSIGIISNLYYGIVVDCFSYLFSGILFIKLFLIYFLARIVFRDIVINKKQLEKFYIFLNIILNIYTIIILFNIPFNFLEVYDIRFNIECISVGFGHPSELDFLAICIMNIQFFILKFLNKNTRKYIPTLIKVAIIILFTGRTKAIVFYVGYVLVLFIRILLKKVKLIYVIPFAPIILNLSKLRITSEFLDTGSARGTLYRTGWKIAKDFWPLGSGFATFGTDFSRKNYSPLYSYYGLSNKYGFSPDWPAYITDAHWAATMGETGFIGMLMYITICILMSILLLTFKNIDRDIKITLNALWIYGIICSFSDTIFMGYRGSAITLITALFLSILTSNKIEKNNEFSESIINI